MSSFSKVVAFACLVCVSAGQTFVAEAHCPSLGESVSVNNLTVDVTVGTVNGEWAMLFDVMVADDEVNWAAIGFRAAGGGPGMAGLDIYAFDTMDLNVTDFNPVTHNGPPSTPDVHQDGIVMDSENNGLVAYMSFYRLMNTGDAEDYSFSPGDSVSLAMATGHGSIGTMQPHMWKNIVEWDALCGNMTSAPTPAPTQMAPQDMSAPQENVTAPMEMTPQENVTAPMEMTPQENVTAPMEMTPQGMGSPQENVTAPMEMTPQENVTAPMEMTPQGMGSPQEMTPQENVTAPMEMTPQENVTAPLDLTPMDMGPQDNMTAPMETPSDNGGGGSKTGLIIGIVAGVVVVAAAVAYYCWKKRKAIDADHEQMGLMSTNNEDVLA